jgi:hypothetical protein
MSRKDEEKKVKKQFWTTFGWFMRVVGLLVLVYFILITLNFFG